MSIECALTEAGSWRLGARPSSLLKECLQSQSLLKGGGLPARDPIGYLLAMYAKHSRNLCAPSLRCGKGYLVLGIKFHHLEEIILCLFRQQAALDVIPVACCGISKNICEKLRFYFPRCLRLAIRSPNC
jgi:hypothetical protein